MIVMALSASAFAQQIQYVGSTLWTAINDMKVTGNYAYCLFRNGLVIFDIAGDSTINEVSKLYLGGGGYGIDLDGNYAYIADGTLGLRIINIANSSNPVVVGTCSTGSNFLKVDISNNMAYIGYRLNTTCGLLIIDVSDPFHPITIGEYNRDIYIGDMAVDGDFAYLLTLVPGLHILNITDPANPFPIGTCSFYGGHGLCLSGNYAYVGISSVCGFKIIDVSQPSSPIVIGEYVQAGEIQHISVSGDYAFIFNTTSGYFSLLEKISISNPTSPVRKARSVFPSWTNDVWISGIYAYLATENGLKVVDISVPTSPSLIASENRTYFVHTNDICISDLYAYLAADRDGVRIMNIANPANPIFAGRFDTPGNAYGVFVQGNYAYVADYSSIQIINITNSSNPVFAGSITTPGISQAIFVAGNYAYIGNYNQSLQIINIANPTNPVNVATFQTQGSVNGVIVRDIYAYVAVANGDILLMSVADPAHPTILGSYDIGTCAKDVQVVDNYAFAVDLYNGIKMIDITNPANPRYVTGYNTPGYAQHVFIQRDYIYLTDKYSFIILHVSSTGIEEIGRVPSDFSLSPNYPNPFNSSTTIRYNLPTDSPVTIDIYDILGRKVQTLLDVKEQAGAHQVNWDAANLPSGAYFARLKAGEQTQSVKMMLMK
jgi:hypothetical protein